MSMKTRWCNPDKWLFDCQRLWWWYSAWFQLHSNENMRTSFSSYSSSGIFFLLFACFALSLVFVCVVLRVSRCLCFDASVWNWKCARKCGEGGEKGENSSCLCLSPCDVSWPKKILSVNASFSVSLRASHSMYYAFTSTYTQIQNPNLHAQGLEQKPWLFMQWKKAKGCSHNPLSVVREERKERRGEREKGQGDKERGNDKGGIDFQPRKIP